MVVLLISFFLRPKNPSIRAVSFKLPVTLLLSIRRRLCAFHPTLSNPVTKSHIPFLYLQKVIERFQVAWYDKDAMKQKEVVSNDKTQRSAAPCKASGLRRLHGVKIVA